MASSSTQPEVETLQNSSPNERPSGIELPSFVPADIDGQTWETLPPQVKDHMMNLSYRKDKVLVAYEKLKAENSSQEVTIAAYQQKVKKLEDESDAKSVKLWELQTRLSAESLKGQKTKEEAIKAVKILIEERNDLKNKLREAEKNLKLLCFLRDAKKYIPDMPDFQDKNLVDECLAKVMEKLEDGTKARKILKAKDFIIMKLVNANWEDADDAVLTIPGNPSSQVTPGDLPPHDDNGAPENAGDPRDGFPGNEITTEQVFTEEMEDESEVPEEMNNPNNEDMEEIEGDDDGVQILESSASAIGSDENGRANKRVKVLPNYFEGHSNKRQRRSRQISSGSDVTTTSEESDVQRDKVKCPGSNCMKWYETMGGLKKHVGKFHKDIPLESIFACIPCGIYLQTKQALVTHQFRFHTNPDAGNDVAGSDATTTLMAAATHVTQEQEGSSGDPVAGISDWENPSRNYNSDRKS